MDRKQKIRNDRRASRYTDCGESDLTAAATQSQRNLQRIRRFSTVPNINDEPIENTDHSISILDSLDGIAVPKLVARSIATGTTMTLLCTSDGQLFQWGTFARKSIAPTRLLNHKIVIQIAVGCGGSTPDIFATGGIAGPGSAMGSSNLRASNTFEGFDNHEGLEDSLFALTTEGKRNLYTWGGNDHGQLGRETKQKFGDHPEPIPFNLEHERISFVSAGCKFTVAISEGNHVFSWGINDKGQLGNATFQVPKKATTNENIANPMSEFINNSGATDITSPFLVRQLEAGYVNQEPFSASVFQEEEEYKGEITSFKYTTRQRLVATGVSHSMLWSSLNQLPKVTSNILDQRDIDMVDLETASDMLEDRFLELSLLRSPDETVMSDDGDSDGDGDDNDNDNNDDDKKDADSQEKKKLKLERQRQRMERFIDPKVRKKKILMTLVGATSQDGAPAPPEMLVRLNNDALVSSAVNTLTQLEEHIVQCKRQISIVKNNVKNGEKEMNSIASRAENTFKNVGVLQDFVEDVPRFRGSKSMGKKWKGMIDAVADDSSQLVLSDRIILSHTEKDRDRLAQQHVLLTHQLTSEKDKLIKLEEEYYSVLQIASSRTKIVILQGEDHGVDAFDAASSLENIASALFNAQPSCVLQSIWESSTGGKNDGVAPKGEPHTGNTGSTTVNDASTDNAENTEGTKGDGECKADANGGIDQSTRNNYTRTAAKSQRTTAQLLDTLRSQINSSKFVHEYGIPTSDPSLQQLKEALANTSAQGQSTHSVGRASVQTGGTSSSHELLKWGSVIMADTLSIEQETEQIIEALLKARGY